MRLKKMGAKKTPQIASKQKNNFAGIAKKASTGKQKDIDVKKDNEKEEEKLIKLISAEANKSPATNNNKKKEAKLVANNGKGITANKETMKKSEINIEHKKNKSRDNSKDNKEKSNISKKQQQPALNSLANNKVNKSNKAGACESDKISNHVTADNKINISTELKKSSNNGENKKYIDENYKTALSIDEDVTKSKEKVNKKNSEENNKITSIKVINSKKSNNRNNDSRSKKIADKSKSKIFKKGMWIKHNNNRIKISNELKNLGIEMTKSNSTFDSIQEGLSIGMKTSICEMVKLKKARHVPNSTSVNVTKNKNSTKITENNETVADNKCENRDSQEKVVKKNEPKSKGLDKSVINVQLKSNEKDDVKNNALEKSKDASLQHDSSIIKKPIEKKQSKASSVENKNSEIINKVNEPKNLKPTKRKYIKKNKFDKEIENKNDAKESQDNKIQGNPCETKSNLISLSGTSDDQIKVNDESKNETSVVINKIQNKEIENESSEKISEYEQNKNDKSNDVLKVSPTKKVKSQIDSSAITKTNNSTEKHKSEIKRKYTKNINSTVKQTNSVKKTTKIQSIKDNLKKKNSENAKNCKTTTNSLRENVEEVGEKSLKDKIIKSKDKIVKETQKVIKNNESKKIDLKKPFSVSPTKTNQNKSNNVKVKVEAKNSLLVQRKEKGTTSKIKKNTSEEKDPLRLSTSESEHSSDNSDSEMELSDDIFKKPAKPKSQQPSIQNKQIKHIEVIKQTRVASLNAIAKVHCLYENEARSHLDATFSKIVKKPTNIICKGSSEDEEDESYGKEIENVSKRSLRTAPGLRGIGKHWEMDSLSSDIDSDSDKSQKAVRDSKKIKSKNKKGSKNQDLTYQSKTDSKSYSKSNNQIKKSIKQSPKSIKALNATQRDSDKEFEQKRLNKSLAAKKSAAILKKKNGSIKLKKIKDNDKSGDIITKKRMASLNASAILAASYEIENYAAKHESSSSVTSDESDNDHSKKAKPEPQTFKKEKNDVKMESTEEARPKSTTNLVKIDTDVTITGVYVNSALVSSQETICKTLKYRTAYSVTEECVVSRPPTQEPPKSYTPLSALTNMRPPNAGGQIQSDQCMTSPTEQYQTLVPQQSQMYDPHMGPYQYQYPPPPSNPMPSTSSAFFPPQPVHRDAMGYYQPAGPLISPHLLQPPPSLEGDQTQPTQQTSGVAGDIDPDVMITGGDLAPRPAYRYVPQPTPDFSRPLHPQQMHYPPAYPPYYYGQHPQPPPVTHQDLCYPYYPPKYFSTNSPYARRPYMSPGYYQTPPLVPQNGPQQIVPAAPTPQHIDPHYSSSPYYPGPNAYNTGGQCYSQPPRNMQPPYLEAPHQYHSTSCPCPMQSCQSKNVHTGTGLIKAKGPVSASNGMADSLSKTIVQSNSGQPTISCKIENISSPNVVIKPENDKQNEEMEDQNTSKSHEFYENRLHSHIPSVSYSMNVQALDASNHSPSPSRGSIGVQQVPTVQHEASVQPSENNFNRDAAVVSHRKYARIGKTMERDRQQQQHNYTIPVGYHNHISHHTNVSMNTNDTSSLMEMSQLKQEYTVKKEKDCVDITMRNFNRSNATSIKVEKSENENHSQQEPLSIPKTVTLLKNMTSNNRSDSPVQNKILIENETVTVNLINESSDECGVDYSIKRKHNHNHNDEVIELSDNSTLEPPTMPVKRRKLLEKPISTPKKSPPNSYKSLIKQGSSSSPSAEADVVSDEIQETVEKTPPSIIAVKPKLIKSSINRVLNKTNNKRKNIIKTKSTFKTMRYTVKVKRRALQKKKHQFLQQRKKATTSGEKLQHEKKSTDESGETGNKNNSTSINNCRNSESKHPIHDDNSSCETIDEEKYFESCERVSNEMSENNEEKSMDGSSEYSGKSNIDLTIDRVAKGYFSESEIFSSLSKHRKTKSQKRFEAKLLDLCEKEKKKRSKERMQNNSLKSSNKHTTLHVPEKEKIENSKKNNKKVNKEINQQAVNTNDSVVNSSPTPSTSVATNESQSNNKSTCNDSANCANKMTPIKKLKKTKAKEPKEIEHKEMSNEKKKKGILGVKSYKEAKHDVSEKDRSKLNCEESNPAQKRKQQQKPSTTSKKPSIVKKTKEMAIKPSTNDSNNDINDDKTIDLKDVSASSTPIDANLNKQLLIDETDVTNNNDECFENNNNKQKQQEPLTLYKTPGCGWTTALVKASRRGKKPRYTNRKKVKLTLPNDIIIPKSTSIPRWSNGWVWEGEPYQALVFLNSDDPPVPRTCFDSMRHEECGDVIKPRDCVLLRAGGKRNELPYVAKVAQLWENPEDGEMMMSLFWYYRPEHTEQGRQHADAVDEVFASRHKDHNSVACIEDKCYVITYNEYCRYRKMLRSIEENVEDQISLVPKLQTNDRRSVPPNTSPELVMFCRRVYDFRGKRLMDDKKKK